MQERDLNDPALDPRGVVVAWRVVASDHVEDDVGPPPPRRLLSCRDKVLGAIVDREVGAELFAGPDLVVGTDGDQHLGAERLGEQDGGDADAGGSAVDKQGFALLEFAALEDVGPNGEIGLGNRRRLFKRKSGRDRQGYALVGEATVGVASPGGERRDPRAEEIAGCPAPRARRSRRRFRAPAHR